MTITKVNPKKFLNKAFLKQRPLRAEIELFKSNLIRLLGKIDEIEREENQKNHLRDFLLDTYYKSNNEINTKDNIDLVIHLGKSNKEKVGVIIEAKRPGNKNEMLSDSRQNVKALHELVLYYLNERIEENNIDIKYLIATNIYEWYIFEASWFEKVFYKNKSFFKQYEEWRDGQKVTKDTTLFYDSIAKPFIDQLEDEIPAAYFDIRNYLQFINNEDKQDDKNLIALFKLLSPHSLLKIPFANDSNSLDEKFYKELLHIIGLEEAKEGGKVIIRRKSANKQAGSLIENTINILFTEDTLYNMSDRSAFGQDKEEQLFNISLELSLTWINRVLFLKLLEGQLVSFHKGDRAYRFLNYELINDYDELYKLFHQVLARNIDERPASLKQKYARVPYLNSSLFEISELESAAIKINSLDNSANIELISSTILKDEQKKNNSLPALEYLFKFLDAYDFSTEGGEDIAEDNKAIINASVLGKVFEKINGYKDGSIFTPGFITMYMSRESLRLAVIQKFNEYYKKENIPEVVTFEDLYNRIDKIDIKKSNEIVNSLRICDPAVGSGHFLVSSLNELIVIKSELGILIDNSGKRLRDYEITVDNDELIIADDNGIFEYNFNNKESRRVQETIFHERQTIIENCLFGVDINPNSVKICRLRLWIELLKSAYYKAPGFTELETLPNIDINIKCGNSLISRFPLDTDLKEALQNSKYNIIAYRLAVMTYRNAKSKDVKRSMQELINSIKSNFETVIYSTDKRVDKLSALRSKLLFLTNQDSLFTKSKSDIAEWKNKTEKLAEEIKKQEEQIEEIKNNAIYKNAFEWRFEFPEVLNGNGDFEGFDVIIGNPPYIQLQKNSGNLAEMYTAKGYKTFERMGDIYSLFYEKGINLLKENGRLTYITSNKWMRANYGKSLREYFLSFNPLLLIDLGPGVFESATVDTNILFIQKTANKNILNGVTLTKETEKHSLSDYIENNKTTLLNLNSDAWFIGTSAESKLKAKIERLGKPLKEWDINIYYGVKTGLNEAFIIDNEMRERLCKEDPRSAEILKPIVRGRDIKRYSYEWAGLWLVFIPWHFPLHSDQSIQGASQKAEKSFKNRYPAIYAHLLQYKDQLEKRNKAETGIRYEWYALQRCAATYSDEFEKEKIVWSDISREPAFTLLPKDIYFNNTVYMIIGGHIKFLAGVLNSRLMKWYFPLISSGLGEKAQRYFKIFVENLPIILPQPKDSLYKKQIEKSVDVITRSRIKSSTVKTNELEQDINLLVYKLYKLTYDEVKIIDPEIEKIISKKEYEKYEIN